MQRIPQVFPGWQADELIGSGAYGKVYKASRTEGGHTSFAAIKVIEIPRDEEEVVSLRSMGMDAASIRSYFEETAQSVVHEVAVMDSLKGAPNVVAIEDYQLIEHSDGVGWSIYIRMELLESLDSYQARVGAPDAREAAKAGVDICRALGFCHKAGVIHRDVKPANLFVSGLGDYKLGDFGLSRRLDEGSRSTKSQAGSGPFMAPEVMTGHYDETVDTYSLGVMLYRWLNGGRPPFIDVAETPTRAALESARQRRLAGERPPAPAGRGVDNDLAAIVCKAVEPNPGDRWGSAAEMGAALQAWLDGRAAGIVSVRGKDLCASIAVPSGLASMGGVVTVSYLIDGAPRSLKMKVPAGTRNGAILRLAGYGELGMGGGGAGDLLVTIVVQDPPAPAPVENIAPAPPTDARPPLLTRRAAIVGGAATAALVALAAVTLRRFDRDSPEDPEQGDPTDAVEGVGESELVEPGADEGSASGPESTSMLSLTIEQAARYAPLIAAGSSHAIGLRPDGTVIAVGDNGEGQCDVSEWSDIVAVTANSRFSVGLRSDGAVVATGENGFGQCDVSDWSGIVAIDAGGSHTAGVRSDGVAIARGFNAYDECDLSDWSDIVAISVGVFHTVGLRSDGTVVATEVGSDGRSDVTEWSEIVAVSAAYTHTVGLRSDGTVVATGMNNYYQCEVSDWTDIVSIAAGYDFTLGLRSDGTVVVAGDRRGIDVSGWTNIVAIAASTDGNSPVVGLCQDGTVVETGYGQCGASSLTGITLT